MKLQRDFGYIVMCIYLANRIQQPIPKLRILNFFPEIRCVFLSGESGF